MGTKNDDFIVRGKRTRKIDMELEVKQERGQSGMRVACQQGYGWEGLEERRDLRNSLPYNASLFTKR
jgi:hypothetical protein